MSQRGVRIAAWAAIIALLATSGMGAVLVLF